MTTSVDNKAISEIQGHCRPNGTGDIIWVRKLAAGELDEAFALARKELDAPVADETVVRAVHAHNPASLWGIFRAANETRAGSRLAGFYSMLLLNRAGAEALRAGALDASAPCLDQLVAPGEQPTAIYTWAVVARMLMLAASPMIARAMGPTYRNIPIYTRAATQDGLRSILRSAYRPVHSGHGGLGDLFWLPEYPADETRRYSHRPAPQKSLRPVCSAIVPGTLEDLAKVFAVRAAVFMTEQGCPYDEEFDGNDFAATHVLGLVDDEPAGVMRLRFFADFAKLERLAVLPRFRRTLVSRQIVQTSIELARRKGYTMVYGHAQARLVKFWGKFGFKPTGGNARLVYSDHDYVEMWGELAPHPDRLGLRTNPYTLLRPEGRWDEPGPLDRSAVRPALNPH